MSKTSGRVRLYLERMSGTSEVTWLMDCGGFASSVLCSRSLMSVDELVGERSRDKPSRRSLSRDERRTITARTRMQNDMKPKQSLLTSSF